MAGEAGCPWARAVPGTPRLIDNCPHTLPKAASTAQPSQAATATWTRTEPCGPRADQSPSVAGAPSWLRPLEHGRLGADPQLGAGSPPRASADRSRRRQCRKRCLSAWPGSCSRGAPKVPAWLFGAKTYEPGHRLVPCLRRDPKTAKLLPSLGCFSLQREPWDAPDDKSVTYPLTRKSRRSCWDPQKELLGPPGFTELITLSLITARAVG